VSKALDVGFVIGLAGAVAAFVATEQLLGVMVSKMLIAKGIGVQFWLTNPPARLQALDIFSMQVKRAKFSDVFCEAWSGTIQTRSRRRTYTHTHIHILID
jgi:hypothetical protein